ncbi:MAG: Gldg family protein [Anaerolineae bacterium]|nr:Gldg family protein [Anaerolineae bacterium]
MNDIRINRNLARWILLGVGVVSLLVMGIAYIATNTFDTVSYISLGIGILGIASFVLLDPQALVTGITGRTSQYGITTVLMSLFFTVFVVAIFIIIYSAKLDPWDLTKEQKYKLSEQTVDILAKLEDDVHVVGFYTEQHASQRKDAELFLQQYEKLSNGKLTYEFVDPDRNPGMAMQLNMTRAGILVFSQGDQTAEASTADERAMSGALVQVMSGEVRKLYMVTGHGERSVDDFNTTGYSEIGQLLGNVNVEIEALNLLEAENVPEDASLVVVAGPIAQFSPIEVETLKSYLDAGGSALFMFDPATGGGQLGNGLRGIAFNRDGSRLATAGADGTVRTWDVGTGKQELELRGHTSDVLDVAYSPDGKQIASVGRDGTVRVWDIASGEQLKQLEGQTTGVIRIAYSPDGRMLASVGENQALNVWNAKTLEPMDYSPISVPSPLYTVQFSPDSSLVAAGGGMTSASGSTEGPIYVWKVKTGEQEVAKTLHTSLVIDIAFSSDGETLHTAAWDGTGGTVDIASGDGSTEMLYPGVNITSLAVREDGTKVYSLADGTVHVREADAKSSDEDAVLSGHTDMIWVMALSPDGKTIATGSRDGTARLWSLERLASIITVKAQDTSDALLGYLAEEWGVRVNDDVVIDLRTQSQYDQYTPIIYTFDQTSPIVSALSESGNLLVFSVARSIQPVETPPQDITLTALLFSTAGSDKSWGETEPSQIVQFNPDKDLPGPVSMGVSAENATTQARVVIYGDADFPSNGFVNQYGNSDLMMNTANWLTESEELLNIPVKNIGSHMMDKPLPQSGLVVVYVTSICLLPAVGLVAGAAVWFVRRRRR